jgi:hypothetical protein
MNRLAYGLISLSLLAISCAPKELAPTQDRPAWIDRGAGVFEGTGSSSFYGVGGATGISSPSLRRTTADAQARADLARTFESKIDNLVKFYNRSISGDSSQSDASEQVAQEATTALASVTLTGTQVIDRYYDKSERTQYSLAKLDASDFKDQLSRLPGLSKEAQEAITRHANDAFRELSQAE